MVIPDLTSDPHHHPASPTITTVDHCVSSGSTADHYQSHHPTPLDWSSIKPLTADYGSAQPFLTTFIDTYNAERSEAGLTLADDITEVYLDEAKAEVLRDLQVALRLNPNNAVHLVYLDEIVDAQQSRFRFAIALVQMIMSWDHGSQGPESMNAIKVKDLQKRYAEERAGFAGLTYNMGSANVTSVTLGT